MTATDRIRTLLDPAYVARVGERALDDVRAMREECAQLEHGVSYLRRLAQARTEILDAELERRARGGDLSDLVADLPRILGAEPGRASVAETRAATADAPHIDLSWDDGRHLLVTDTTLAHIADTGDDELQSTVEQLRSFERELSEARRGLHAVLDVLEREIAARQVAGTAG